MVYYICGIDIGIIHLGISFIEVNKNEDTEILTVIEFELINLKELTDNCDMNCGLYHSNTISDRLSHFLKIYQDRLEICKYIFIEQQPIHGISSVEQLIYNKYRNKSYLVNPKKIHKYFGLSTNVDLRKSKSVQLVNDILSFELKEQLKKYERKHDITDSVLIAMTGLYHKQNEIIKVDKLNKSINQIDLSIFEKFKYRVI